MLKLDLDPAPHLIAYEQHLDVRVDLKNPLQNEILKLLKNQNNKPIPTVDIRQNLCKRKADVVDALEKLKNQNLVNRCANGWVLVNNP